MRTLLLRISALFGSLALLTLGAAPAFADHTTRNSELQKTGIDIWITALSIGGIVLVLIAFAAVVLWWERNDKRQESAAGDSPEASRID